MEQTKPELKIIGEDGNIFNLLAITRRRCRELKKEEPEGNWDQKWKDLNDGVTSSKSYGEALGVFTEYFDVQ
ncbi:MAG: hypothetical protein U9R12_05725 [Candidatus Caldatribacteriota bacterium]|nr:hypothetical protein [Candidatus Caldatribacteriota bacterium]